MPEITYTQVGDYLLPNLVVGDEPQPAYGKYGMLRKTYLKNHRPGIYSSLLRSGRLNAHLAKVDDHAKAMLGDLVQKHLRIHPAPDKASKQMEWICYMNNLKHSLEEIVLKEVVYYEE